MESLKMKILSNVQVSERYWHLSVDASQLQTKVSPGQFFYIRCGEAYYPFLRRPFSIYRINKQEKVLEFLYLTKGLGTKRLTEMKAGEKIDIFGPLGHGFTLKDDASNILLLARGVGIATLAALAQEALEKNVKTTAILSARTYDDLLATETLQSFGAIIHKVTDEDGTSDVHNVSQLVDTIMDRDHIHAAYTCGSKRLARLLQEKTRERQIPAEIALEENMGCAMGVCFACVCDIQEEDEIRSVRICLDGPVFPLEKVIIP